MTLEEFMKKNNVDYTRCRISEDSVPAFECELGVKFGEQLREYITKYGHLFFLWADLYGINSYYGVKSDMIEMTKRLRSRNEKLNKLIAIEDRGDGDYYLVDENDDVYHFIEEADLFENLHIKLYDYIVERFTEVKEYNKYMNIND